MTRYEEWLRECERHESLQAKGGLMYAHEHSEDDGCFYGETDMRNHFAESHQLIAPPWCRFVELRGVHAVEHLNAALIARLSALDALIEENTE